MMRERGVPESDSETVAIDVTYEVYLKDRDDPVNVVATFALRKSVLQEDNQLEDFMKVAINHVLGVVDVVGEHRLIFSDEHFNKFMFLTDQIQAVSILAPSEETLISLLEE